jgi:hypothetical protein
MSRRVSHALRYAVTTLAAVYVMGVAWELFDVFVRGDVAEGLTAADTFRFNEQVWRVLAVIETLVVFLSRLSDLARTPPTWSFAWITAGTLAVATVVAGNAVEEREWLLAVLTALAAVAAWFLVLRRLPGRPQRDGRIAVESEAL